MTVTTQLVVGAPLAEPGEEKYGPLIVAGVGLRAAALNELLADLLNSRREQPSWVATAGAPSGAGSARGVKAAW